MTPLLLAIDQGTTGTTVLLVDAKLQIVSKATEEFEQIFPKPGWVEHKAQDIWASLRMATQKSLAQAQIDPKQIAAIGIANQRETTCLFSKNGEPLHNFIVWQCRRSAEICARLKK